jgi:hypothetical protein
MKEAKEIVAITHSSKSLSKRVFNHLSLGTVFPMCHTDFNSGWLSAAHVEKHRCLLSKALITCKVIIPTQSDQLDTTV